MGRGRWFVVEATTEEEPSRPFVAGEYRARSYALDIVEEHFTPPHTRVLTKQDMDETPDLRAALRAWRRGDYSVHVAELGRLRAVSDAEDLIGEIQLREHRERGDGLTN